jgi:hypothetical protein
VEKRSRPLTGQQILSAWEAAWHPLTADQIAAFLMRPEVSEMAGMPGWAVESAIKKVKPLAEVVEFARGIIVLDQKFTSKAAPLHTSSETSSDAGWRVPYDEAKAFVQSEPTPTWNATPRSRPTKRGGTSLPALVRGQGGPGGTQTGGASGSRSTYASGMARNPGRPEQTSSERCSQCGAPVANGSVHDCA